MTQRTITHVSPTLYPLFMALIENLDRYELIPTEQFARHFPPAVLAACLASKERAVLRGIILHEASGLRCPIGEKYSVHKVIENLSDAREEDPEHYQALRMHLSATQLVEIAPDDALVKYLTETPWWIKHWHQDIGDVNAPSAHVLIAVLNAIDAHGILTPSEKIHAIGPALFERLDVVVLRSVLQGFATDERINERLRAGAVNTKIFEKSPNPDLVTHVPPDALINVVRKAIEKYGSASETVIEGSINAEFSESGPTTVAQGKSTLSPTALAANAGEIDNQDLPVVLGGSPAGSIPDAIAQHTESAPPSDGGANEGPDLPSPKRPGLSKTQMGLGR